MKRWEEFVAMESQSFVARVVRNAAKWHDVVMAVGRAPEPDAETLWRAHVRRCAVDLYGEAYGPKNSERKMILVENYWRGPEDAPMPLRNHTLGTNAS